MTSEWSLDPHQSPESSEKRNQWGNPHGSSSLQGKPHLSVYPYTHAEPAPGQIPWSQIPLGQIPWSPDESNCCKNKKVETFR